jgi:ornithine decarboxylase
MVLAEGARPERTSIGNTIKRERDIALALALGVNLYAVDSTAKSIGIPRGDRLL